MKKYLRYLGYGFLTFFIYYAINLMMALINLAYRSAYYEIYGFFDFAENPNVLLRFFIVLSVVLILILLGFFFLGRGMFKFGKEKLFPVFVLFIIPNIALQILIYYSYSIELMSLLNWYLAPLSDVFFFETQTAYDWRFSYLGNSLLTYLPFIAAFLGGLSKRNRGNKNNTADI